VESREKNQGDIPPVIIERINCKGKSVNYAFTKVGEVVLVEGLIRFVYVYFFAPVLV
jgi:hypothetical protein